MSASKRRAAKANNLLKKSKKTNKTKKAGHKHVANAKQLANAAKRKAAKKACRTKETKAKQTRSIRAKGKQVEKTNEVSVDMRLSMKGMTKKKVKLNQMDAAKAAVLDLEAKKVIGDGNTLWWLGASAPESPMERRRNPKLTAFSAYVDVFPGSLPQPIILDEALAAVMQYHPFRKHLTYPLSLDEVLRIVGGLVVEGAFWSDTIRQYVLALGGSGRREWGGRYDPTNDDCWYDSDDLDDMLEEGSHQDGVEEDSQGFEFEIPFRTRHDKPGGEMGVGKVHVDEKEALRTGQIIRMPFRLKPKGY